MSFYLSFKKQLPDGSTIDLYPKLKQISKDILNGQKVSSRTQKKTSHGKYLSEKVRYDILMRLGYFVTESSEHFSEYVPWYIKNNQPELIDKFKIPIDDYIFRCENQNKIWKNHSENLTHDSNLEISSSDEYASQIIKSIAASKKIQINGNVINNGSIKNLPNDCCVEIPCDIDQNGIYPQEIGNLPLQLAGLIYLTPNIDPDSGTSLFDLKSSTVKLESHNMKFPLWKKESPQSQKICLIMMPTGILRFMPGVKCLNCTNQMKRN